MTNEELKALVSITASYKIKTKDNTYTGHIDGPYDGFDEATLEHYKQDHIYIRLLTEANKTICIYSEDVESISQFEY